MDRVGLGKNEGEDGWGGLTKTKEIREIHMEIHYIKNSSLKNALK